MSDFKKLDLLLERFAATSVPGCTCAVMHKGELVYSSAKGYADIENNIPTNTETVYRQASMTKLFTYTIMGMLFEEGAFLLSDPISNYLPEWKATTRYKVTEGGYLTTVPSKPITIRDAMAMTCGLPYCMIPDPDSPDATKRAMSAVMEQLLEKGIPTLREEVNGMASVPLAFEPGSHFLYGFGSEIVGAIVETLTEKPLRQVFREKLIEPLELTHTDTWITSENEKLLCKLYHKNEHGELTAAPAQADDFLRPSKYPEGARPHLLTTAEDYVKFMYMLANGGTYNGKRFLGRKTVDLLHDNQLNETALKDFHNDYLAGYGYGLGFRTLLSNAEGGHNGSKGAFGWTGGSGTWAEADPTEQLAIVYMHNMSPNEELYHHLRVRACVYGGID